MTAGMKTEMPAEMPIEMDVQEDMMKKRLVTSMMALMGCAVLAVSALALSGCSSKDSSAGSSAGNEAEQAGDAEQTGYTTFNADDLTGAYDISGDDLVYVAIDVEDYGTITVALDQTVAPLTVENFVTLAEEGFYDGLTFHRIMEGFMIQGGDPNGNGSGGSDEYIKGEFEANGVENPITHVRGAISMARAYDNDSASSQFFIMQADASYLDGQYAGFGYVTDGMDVVDQICADAEPTDDNGTIEADKQPVITTIRVLE